MSHVFAVFVCIVNVFAFSSAAQDWKAFEENEVDLYTSILAQAMIHIAIAMTIVPK